MARENLIRTALGERKPDLVLKNAKVVDVFSGDIYPADVAIADGRIAGIGSYSGPAETDLAGRYLAPGFINAHCHVESSMVTPPAYCQEELAWGVTTLITDPHEIANVAGAEGIRFMLDASAALPVNYYVQVPSCVPATPFENAGAVLDAKALEPFLREPRVLGLGEMMNYPGVANCDPDVLDKLNAFSGRVIDGHAPMITGKGLQAYAAAGIQTDHESTCYEEAREKLHAGMAVLVREGSAGRHVRDILSGVVRDQLDTRHMAFCTDDKHLVDIRREGGVRYNVKLAVELGMSPVDAIRMATINAAQIYGLRGLGAVAPGYRADLVVLEDLQNFAVAAVYKDGKAFSRGAFAFGLIGGGMEAARHSVKLPTLSAACFALPQRERQPVVNLLPGQIATAKSFVPSCEVDDLVAAGELRKIAVIERHHATGSIGVGLLAGYGLTHGAVATTVAHDSHNLIVAGDNDADMLAAVKAAERMQGGFVLVRDGQVLGELPLPIYGLMSDLSADELIARLDALIETAHKAGIREGIDPFITLSFLALPVIPEIRVTDLGVFDVTSFSFIK